MQSPESRATASAAHQCPPAHQPLASVPQLPWARADSALRGEEQPGRPCREAGTAPHSPVLLSSLFCGHFLSLLRSICNSLVNLLKSSTKEKINVCMKSPLVPDT